MRYKKLFLQHPAVSIFIFQSALALGANPELSAQLFLAPQKAGEQSIQGLSWRKTNYPVREEDGKVIITLEGVFHETDYSLLFENERIKPDSDSGNFQLKIPLNSEKTSLILIAITPMGKVQSSSFYISCDKYSVFAQELAEERKLLAQSQTGSRWNAGLAYSSIIFNQSDAEPMNQTALTAKIGWSGLLSPPRWDLGFTSFFTALPLSNTRKDLRVRFFGFNGRFGYIVPQISEPWKLSLMFGYYYTTMFVSGGKLGYRNLQGLMLFPVLRRSFQKGKSASAYLKFSPITSSFSLLSLSSHEKAAGLSYAQPLSARYSLSLSLDISKFVFAFNGVSIENSTYSLGAGLGF